MTDYHKTIGRYEVIEVIGQGAMGIVYKARDPNIDRIVAIKTIKTTDIESSPEGEELIKRFKREVQTAGLLTHANIVTIHDGGQDGDLHWIAMEYVDGPSLAKLLAEKVIISLSDLLSIFVKICSALDFAHKKGIIHRDMKPANVLLTQEWEPKIADFGIARLASSTMTRTGVILGTPSYMSPEQITGQKVDSRSDIFSLGIILYELITGERPFLGDNPTTIMYRIVHSEPLPPSKVNITLPSGLSEIVMRALAKNPEQRYQSAGNLAHELIKLVKTSPEFSVSTSRLDMPTAALSSSEVSRSFDFYQTVESPTLRKKRSPVLVGVLSLISVVVVLVIILVIAGQMSGSRNADRGAEAEQGGAAEVVEKPANEEKATISRQTLIKSDPPGASVFIDGAKQEGETPLTVTLEKPEGENVSIRVEKDGLTAQNTIVMAADLLEEMPVYTLAQAVRRVTVTSRPSGATVFLNGRNIGKTPKEDIEIAPDAATQLRLALSGYVTQTQDLTWENTSDGQTVDIVLSEVKYGTFVFRTMFPVSVKLSGRELERRITTEEIEGLPALLRRRIQRTDTTINLPTGDYSLDLSNDEVFFRLNNVRITVDEGRNNQPLNLPLLGIINVVAEPREGCIVSIDGKEIGLAGPATQQILIVAGNHEVTFDWQGVKKTESVVVRPIRRGQPIQVLQGRKEN
jgi:serine/threonine protein kinase